MFLNKFIHIILAGLVFAACMVITSCNGNIVYHRYMTTNQEGWNCKDTLIFRLDSLKAGNYNTYIGIRHTESYPYRDLWLSVSTMNGGKNDTLHIYLANDRGNWNSNGSTGGFYQYETNGPLLHYINKTDSVIKITHVMRDNPLKYITDIGLKISK